MNQRHVTHKSVFSLGYVFYLFFFVKCCLLFGGVVSFDNRLGMLLSACAYMRALEWEAEETNVKEWEWKTNCVFGRQSVNPYQYRYICDTSNGTLWSSKPNNTKHPPFRNMYESKCYSLFLYLYQNEKNRKKSTHTIIKIECEMIKNGLGVFCVGVLVGNLKNGAISSV